MANATFADFAFDSTSPEAIRVANRIAADLVVEVSTETRAAIRQAIVDAITNGRPPLEAAREILGVLARDGSRVGGVAGLTRRDAQAVRNFREQLQDAGLAPERVAAQTRKFAEKKAKERAANIARTETMNALNAGQNEAWRQQQKNGLLGKNAQKEWIVTPDDRLCQLCAPLDGETVPIGDNFSWGGANPPRHPRCLPGHTLVSPCGRVTATSERWYDGDLVTISTATGKQLSVTPNHPILTDSGWVPAGLLNKGGYVISSPVGKWKPSSRDVHNQEMPSRIEDVARSFGCPGEVSAVPVPLSAEDFHGDGVGSKIAVVRTNGPLSDGINPTVVQHRRQSLLVRTVVATLRLARLGGHAERFLRWRNAPGCAMCGCDLGGPALGTHAGPLHGFGGTATTQGHARLRQDTGDDLAASAELARELQNGLAGKIVIDKIIKIRKHNFSGHVYNLQTETGAYWASGIITHNCRCAHGISDPFAGPKRDTSIDRQERLAREGAPGAAPFDAAEFRERTGATQAPFFGATRRPPGGGS